MTKILIDRTVVEQALKALEHLAELTGARWALEKNYSGHLEAISALRAALAEPVQEPVACKPLCELCVKRGYDFCANVAKVTPIIVCPAPPQRKPLKEDEIEKAIQQVTK